MKAANEMYEYIVKNKLGDRYAKRAYLKHFKLIEDSLFGDEEVIYCFMGRIFGSRPCLCSNQQWHIASST